MRVSTIVALCFAGAATHALADQNAPDPLPSPSPTAQKKLRPDKRYKLGGVSRVGSDSENIAGATTSSAAVSVKEVYKNLLKPNPAADKIMDSFTPNPEKARQDREALRAKIQSQVEGTTK